MANTHTPPVSFDSFTVEAASATSFWAKIVGAWSSSGGTHMLVRASGSSTNKWMLLNANLAEGSELGLTALTKGYQVWITTDSSGSTITNLAIYS